MLGFDQIMPMNNMPGLNFGLGQQSSFTPTSQYMPLGAGAGGGFFGNSGFGFNMPTAQLALGGLNALGSLWGANKALGLARDQFNFTKDITQTNLRNQTQSYNTALEDRYRTRAVAEGRSQADAEADLEKHRLR